MQEIFDVIIIGGGPAGLTASIYAKRANLNTLLIESQLLANKLYKISEIENYPSYKNITGNELAEKFIEQINHLEIKKTIETVKKVEKINDLIQVDTNKNSYLTKTVLVSTGDKEKLLDLANSKEYIGKGISYCAVCDGFFFRNKEVIVIGGGNSALQEALYLSNIVSKVTIIIRRDEFRADKSLITKVINNDKIQIIKNHLPYELIIEDDILKGLKIQNVLNDAISNIYAQAIFPYIGSIANTDFLNKDILDKNGYIIVNNNMETSIEGIYAAGDCTTKKFKQIVSACFDGAFAINNIYNKLF